MRRKTTYWSPASTPNLNILILEKVSESKKKSTWLPPKLKNCCIIFIGHRQWICSDLPSTKQFVRSCKKRDRSSREIQSSDWSTYPSWTWTKRLDPNISSRPQRMKVESPQNVILCSDLSHPTTQQPSKSILDMLQTSLMIQVVRAPHHWCLFQELPGLWLIKRHKRDDTQSRAISRIWCKCGYPAWENHKTDTEMLYYIILSNWNMRNFIADADNVSPPWIWST